MRDIDQLRQLIREQFESLSGETYPFFYSLIQTDEGYKNAEALVIRYAVRNRLSVAAAIAQLEQELA